MSIKSRNVLRFLRDQLNNLQLDEVDDNVINECEKKLVNELFSTIDKFNDQDNFFVEEDDELYKSNAKDIIYEPVYEDLFFEESYFSYEYITKVLNFKDAHPNYSFSSIQHNFRKVKNRSYLYRFKTYKDNQGIFLIYFITFIKKLRKII
jgi:hypothetical protein